MREDDAGRKWDQARVRGALAGAGLLPDAEAILVSWRAARSLFDLARCSLPRPAWAGRDYEHDGEAAWRELVRCAPRGPAEAISIYVHVPFCDRRCGFCDCYSLPLRTGAAVTPGPSGSARTGAGSREQAYVESLLREMDAWCRLDCVGDRPVTTVHFGGGTPNALRPASLARVVEECRSRFGATPATEWALESTSRLLGDDHLDELRDLGFSRLHVGVQTLEDEMREGLGRKESAEAVTGKLARAVEKGFAVSVDMIYGLPGQEVGSFLEGLDRLVSTGVHGFSLYRLQVTRRNRGFMKRLGADARDAVVDYLLFQAGEQYLRSRGFRKNHFTHFALRQDRQLYYRHAQRGEDLLALGPTADGRFGHYLYRHPEYRGFVGPSPPAREAGPALEGGMWESRVERRTHRARTGLMASSVAWQELRELDAEPLLELWLAGDMLAEGQAPSAARPALAGVAEGPSGPGSERFELTANGSWLIDTMIRQLVERVAAAERESGAAVHW